MTGKPVRADADKPHFALLPGDFLRLDQLVLHRLRFVLAVQVPDVEVIGPEFLQAHLEFAECALFGFGVHLGGKDDVFPLAAERGADHPLVVALLIPAGAVEVVDAHVRGTGDHGRVGGDHATVTDGGDLQARLTEDAVSETLRRWLERRGDGGRRYGKSVRRGQCEPRSQEVAS